MLDQLARRFAGFPVIFLSTAILNLCKKAADRGKGPQLRDFVT